MLLFKFIYYEKQKLINYIKGCLSRVLYFLFRFFYFFFWLFSFVAFSLFEKKGKKTFRIKILYFITLFVLSFIKKNFWVWVNSIFLFHRFFLKYFSFFFYNKMKKRITKFFVWKSSFKFVIFYLLTLPNKRTLFSVLRSPFIYKKSFEQFGVYWYKSLINMKVFCPVILQVFFQEMLKKLVLSTSYYNRPIIKIKKVYNYNYFLEYRLKAGH